MAISQRRLARRPYARVVPGGASIVQPETCREAEALAAPPVMVRKARLAFDRSAVSAGLNARARQAKADTERF